MLIFYCTDCKETIQGPDHESPGEILDRLDEHIAKCPLATFTFEGRSEVARERAEVLRSVISHERLSGKMLLH